jgi:heme exporter protein B
LNSSWQAEIAAVLRKEIAIELRTRSGLVTSGLFSIVAVVAMAYAAFGMHLDGQIAAGMMWVVLVFASVVALPRAFVIEEEQGTGDLLRMWARPHAVFWGKTLYNLLLMLLTGIVLSVLFMGFVGTVVVEPGLYVVCLVGGCIAMAASVTLCGALVAHASNRSGLAGAIAIPVLIPLAMLAVQGLKIALGSGFEETGPRVALGLMSYAVATLAIGPQIFAAVWKS